MCTQNWDHYMCGCKTKGVFRQCDAKYDAETNLQCTATEQIRNNERSYCSKHLPREHQATEQYVGRQVVGRGRGRGRGRRGGAGAGAGAAGQ